MANPNPLPTGANARIDYPLGPILFVTPKAIPSYAEASKGWDKDLEIIDLQIAASDAENRIADVKALVSEGNAEEWEVREAEREFREAKRKWRKAGGGKKSKERLEMDRLCGNVGASMSGEEEVEEESEEGSEPGSNDNGEDEGSEPGSEEGSGGEGNDEESEEESEDEAMQRVAVVEVNRDGEVGERLWVGRE